MAPVHAFSLPLCWLLWITVAACMSRAQAAAKPLLRIAGSSTVYPVATRWAAALAANYSFTDASGVNTVCDGNSTICGGGSSTGAKRVCLPRDHPDKVDIGDMSRDWKEPKEVVRLDDGYTLECSSTKIRVTQHIVGVDGLAVVVSNKGPAASCMMAVGGLTLAQLRWTFSDWTDAALETDKDGGVDMSSVLKNDNHNGVKEWSDLSAECEQVPINTYGPGAASGTSGFFGEVVFCADCFAEKSGFTPELFPDCPAEEIHHLENLHVAADIKDYLDNHRPINCYMPSEDDDEILEWVETDTGGIAYFGFAYYAKHAAKLSVVRVASDRVKGVQDTSDALIMPSSYSIIDGSYAVFTRSLFMNVDNEVWPLVKDFMEFGFSAAGMALVADAGYVTINSALLAKMKSRVATSGNPSADYVTLPPAECPVGTELRAEDYVNAFGTPKVNYTCIPCQPGFAKGDNRPISCSPCADGTYAETAGQSECRFCVPGTYAPAGSRTCSSCPINTAGSMPGLGACMPCEDGFFAEVNGSLACDRCPMGTFRERGGTESCAQCPAGMSTEFRAASHLTDCACAEGSFLAAGGTQQGPCVGCPAGLECGFGSAFENFQEVAKDPAARIPRLPQHHWSDPADPLSAYVCRIEDKACPGGAPGVCNGGRVGLVCALCPEGQTWDSDRCVECDGGFQAVAYVMAIGLCCAICAAHYFGNSPRVSNVTIGVAGSTLASQVLTIVQLLAMFKDLNVEWPVHIRGVLTGMSFFMGSSAALSYECFLGSSSVTKYAFRCAMPVYLVLNTLLLFVGSRFMPLVVKKFKPWDVDATLNTLSQVLQAVFIGVAAIVVVPLQCYSHPNGKSSLSQYPEILCFEGGDHSVLFAMACVIAIVFVVPFMAYCVWGSWVVVYPGKNATNLRTLRRFRFLFFRFRDDKWWWGNVFMARQTLLAFAPSISEPLGQSIYVILVLAMYGMWEAHAWPWKAPEFNLLDLYVTSCLIISITISTAFIPGITDTAFYATVLTIVLVILGVGAVLLGAGIFVVLLKSRTPNGTFGMDSRSVRGMTGQKLFEIVSVMHKGGCKEFVEVMSDMSYYDRQMLFKGIATYQACRMAGKEMLSTRLAGQSRSGSGSGSREMPPVPKTTEIQEIPTEARLVII